MFLIRPGTLFFLLAISALIQAQEAPIPDGARPGAIRPEQSDRPTIPMQIPDEVFEAPDSVLEVPPVIDRPFEIDDGPKVVVRHFRLLDAGNLPGYGVSLAEMESILQQQAEARPEGFTVGQLQLAADQITLYYRNKGLILAQAVVPVQTVDDGVVDIQVFIGTLGRVIV
ncbi:MAG: POTRA domain-containing protein, partial [Gammaproteobacteria bacterium]